jgi:hypothetical protein
MRYKIKIEAIGNADTNFWRGAEKENMEDELLEKTGKISKVSLKNVHLTQDEILEREKDMVVYEFENMFNRGNVKVKKVSIEAI